MKVIENVRQVKEMITHLLYFKENYKLIAIDLSKQQALDIDPKSI